MPARIAPAWHVISFEERAEAAAFVAALSRFLASPAGEDGRGSGEPPEVWAATAGTTIAVLLSVGALEAASAAFAPVPASARASALPHGSRLLIDAGTPPLGVEQVALLIAG